MKKRFAIWGICLMVILLIGCGKGEEPVSTEPINTLDSIELKDFMSYQPNETYYYTGPVDYARYEVCVKVDELISPKPGKLYYLEGEVDDLSDGEAGDLSFIKSYKVTSDEITRAYGESFETILVQKPIEIGNTWETSMLDDAEGILPVVATIKAADENTITIEYALNPVPAENAKSFEITLSKGKGIISEKQIYDDSDFEIVMSKKSTAPDKNFVSRYLMPTDLLKKLYTQTPLADQVMDARAKQEIQSAGEDEEALNKAYVKYLSELPTDRLYTVSRAKKMLNYAVECSKTPLKLIKSFVDYYETTTYSYSENWISDLGLYDMEGFDKHYSYAEAYHAYAVNLNGTGEDRAVNNLLRANGVGLQASEGYPYFTPTAWYLESCSNLTDETALDYINFKTLQYKTFPIQNEGYLIVSAKEIGSLLNQFDAIYRKHSDLEAFSESKDLSDYLFEVFSVPNEFYIEGNYVGGFIAPEYYDAYKAYVEANPKSSYTSVLKTIVKLLDEHSKAFNSELNKYLVELGYSPDQEMFTERNNQIDEFEAIAGKSERLKSGEGTTVTANNADELLAAIGSNKTILLNPGLYQIPSEYSGNNANVEIVDGALKIKNVENLNLIAKSGMADIITDNYMEAMILDNCRLIQMDGLRIGHMQSYCVGDVLMIKSSETIRLNRLILFGCGFNGLNLEDVNGVTMTDSLISDCQARGLIFNDTKNVLIDNVHFYRDGKVLFEFKGVESIVLDSVVAADNDKDAYDDYNALFIIDEKSSVTVRNSKLDETYVKALSTGGGIVNVE